MIWNISAGRRLKASVAKTDKRDAVRAEVREGVDQMLQRTTEAINLPDEHGVELAKMGLGHFFEGSLAKFKPIQRTGGRPHMLPGNMKVPSRGFQAAMPQQDLDGAQIGARLEQMGGKAVAPMSLGT